MNVKSNGKASVTNPFSAFTINPQTKIKEIDKRIREFGCFSLSFFLRIHLMGFTDGVNAGWLRAENGHTI